MRDTAKSTSTVYDSTANPQGLNARTIFGNTIMMVVAMAAACWALWPIYQSAEFLQLVGATLVAGAVIAILGSVLRWPGIVVAALTVFAYLALGVPLAIPDRAVSGIIPTFDGLRELLVASALAWKQLLTISLPVGSYQALLVPVFILVLLGTVSGLSLLLRARWSALGMLAPVVVFIAGIVFGPSHENWPVVKGLVLLVVTIAWQVWLRWDSRVASIRLMAVDGPTIQRPEREHRRAAWQGLVAAGVILALAVAGGAAAAVTLPVANSRDVLRTRIVQPFDPRSYPSPLAGFRSYLQPQSDTSAMITVTGLPADGHIRIATLDTYDGVVYTVGSDAVSSDSGRFARVPYRLDQSGTAGKRVTLQVTIDEYSGVWVPGLGKLAEISFGGNNAARLTDSFYYNGNTGTAVVTTGLAPGDTYSAVSVVKQMATTEQLQKATPGTTTLPALTIVPDELANTLAKYAPTTENPGMRLFQMLEALKSNGYISHGITDDEPASRSGHAADRISQLLTEKPMVGDQEQYAVTAALMARQLGFPARVVIGFAVPDEGVSPTTPVTVTGSDISAWIEVETAESGWMSVDPTPALRPVPPKQPEDPTVVSRPQSVVQPPPAEQLEQQVATPPETTQEDDAPPPNPWLVFFGQVAVVLGWTAIVLALALAPFMVIIAAKLRRRRLRRRAATALQRISGGWQEFEDTVRDNGFQPPAAATRSEVAVTVGGMRPLVLASVADRAVFSPIDPSDVEADRVWSAVADLRGSLAIGKTRWQRIKALISVRSFDGYHGRRKE